METNPFVEPDAPLPPNEGTPQTSSTDNLPPESAESQVSEIATETAAAEALPEPMVEVAEQTVQPVPPETPVAQEPESKPSEEVSEIPVSDDGLPMAPVDEAPDRLEEKERSSESESQAHQPELEFALNRDQRVEETQATQMDEAQPEPESEPAIEVGEEVKSVEASEESRPEGELGEQPSSEAAENVESQEAPLPEGAQGEVFQDPLAAIADHAQMARLSPADEERAVTLLKEALLDGRAGVVRAIQALPKLPWVIGVNAVTAVWPELKPAFRSQMLAGLVRTEGDQAKRIRLSLARGLFKQDVPIALKIIVGAAREMRNRETGAMSPKHAQIFANVLIGRAKPWIAQLPLADVKPNDADVLVHCALLAAFSLPHAPITQLGIIKWAAEAGRLGKIHQTVVEAAQKSLGRWSGKWQNALRKEVTDLPESFVAVLKVSQPKDTTQAPPEKAEVPESEEAGEISDGASPEPDAEAEAAEVVHDGSREEAEEPDAEFAEAAKAEAIVDEDEEEENEDEEEEDEDEEEEDEEEDEDEDGEEEEEEEREPSAERPQPKPRPVYESKTIPRKPQQGQAGQQQQPQQAPHQQGKGNIPLKDASVPDLFRQLEAQFQSLRSELHSAQNKLRQRDEELRRLQKRAGERASAPVIEGEPTPEELARLNRQLESRNQELQARIEELLADSEARAVSVGAVSGEPVEDVNTQLRTLLGLKMQEDYEDFLALEKESPDIVVQQHYRTVLRHVFDVLTNEGVRFDLSKTENIPS